MPLMTAIRSGLVDRWRYRHESKSRSSNVLSSAGSTYNRPRSVSLLSETDGYVLRGKTGSGPVVPGEFDGAFEGWLVGWVEKPDAGAVAFALYVSGPSFESIGSFRYQMSARFLRAIGALK